MKFNLSIKEVLHALIFSILSIAFLFFLHHLPLNQLFIDPFSEAIKNHDVMDISISKFRNHNDPTLFDDDIFIINSEITCRKEIAETVNFLLDKEVGAIGLDLIFDSLRYDKADTTLAEAFGNEKVVMGYSFKEHKDHEAASVIDIKSDPFFTQNAKEAYINLASNDGYSVRAFEPFHKVGGIIHNSFAVELAALVNPDVKGYTFARGHEKEWINFRRIQPGKANMITPINSKKVTHYGYSGITQFLKDTASYADEYFKGKIVLIGFCGEFDNALSMKDRYFTPLNEKYNGRAIPDMHGVVVHANIISMLNSKDFIEEVSEKYLYLIAFILFFINYLIFTKLARRKLVFMLPTVRVIQLLQFVLLFTAAISFMATSSIKFGFILVITAVILSYELFEFYAHKMRNKMAQRINKFLQSSEDEVDIEPTH